MIGSLPCYKQVLLRLGGLHGDRARGIEQMQSAAEHGRYLRIFAKIMLALAYEREGQLDHARQLLDELATEFPSNPVFSRELALLDQKPQK
jgi:predicted Zn-dependent protease